MNNGTDDDLGEDGIKPSPSFWEATSENPLLMKCRKNLMNIEKAEMMALEEAMSVRIEGDALSVA